MDHIIQALQAAYAESWKEILAGSVLFDLIYFVVGGLFYFFISARHDKALSLDQLPRYIVDPHLTGGLQPVEHARQSARIDRRSWVVRLLWAPPLIAITTTLGLALGVYLAGRFDMWFGVRTPVDWPRWAILLCQASVIFLVGDFGNYWNHRWMHRVPIYWAFHRVHHSAETLNYFTGDREHPLEVFPSAILQGLWNGLGTATVLWLTGTNLLTSTLPILVGLGVIWNIRTILFHSHFPLSFGPLDYVIGGPIMHQLHHSAEVHHYSRNFGVQLMCWDWLFGSIYVPAKGETFRLGLSADELGPRNPHRTLKSLYLEPIHYAWRVLFPARAPSGKRQEAE